MTKAILLVNLGTPQSASAWDVALYLHEFLSDKRVIDIPWIIRKILLLGIILPTRSFTSAKNYQQVWTAQGSPLLVNSQAIASELQKNVDEQTIVRLAMRYGQPSIKKVLAKLLAEGNIRELVIVPLFPQYSSAATGSAMEECLQQVAKYTVIPKISIIDSWYKHPAYIRALVTSIKEHDYSVDEHLVFSFHGLPQRQVDAVCTNHCDSQCQCYRAQCTATAQLIARQLYLPQNAWSIAFQSRLGRTPWLKPYLDGHLEVLYAAGVRKICLISPGFSADCLETIEELGREIKHLWLQMSDTHFKLIPCLNGDGAKVVAAVLRDYHTTAIA
jgi:ferrochelatase